MGIPHYRRSPCVKHTEAVTKQTSERSFGTPLHFIQADQGGIKLVDDLAHFKFANVVHVHNAYPACDPADWPAYFAGVQLIDPPVINGAPEICGIIAL
jgi:hypothetical protein